MLTRGSLPLAGTYVTDGSSLFRVQQSYVDARSGARVLELEDCATLELSAWTPVKLAERPLRAVTPMDAAKLARATFESELGRPLDGLVAGGSE
jgi:hypothetical protein